MFFFRSIILFSLLVIAQVSMAQKGATIKVSVNKTKILLGEPMLLTVEVLVPARSSARFKPIDSIAHFELLDKPQIDSSHNGNATTIKGMYKITSFDSGHWVIPPFSLSRSVRSDSIPVDVVFSDFDPAQDYHDIKDIIDVKVKTKKQWWWWAAGGSLLLLLLLLYFLRKKRPLTAAKPTASIDPYKEAMNELEKLQKEKPAFKQYHIELIDIFRRYVFKKKSILSLQKTTDDLIVQLRSLGMNNEQFENLSQSLRLSDFVKFARYTPTGQDDKEVFEAIRGSIMAIEKSTNDSTSPGLKGEKN